MFGKAVLIAVALVLFTVVATAADGSATYVPDEVLIKLESSSRARHSIERITTDGARVVQEFRDLGWRRVKIPAGMTVNEALRDYARLDGVIGVQPNFYYRLMATPNDPDFGLSGMYGLTKIGAPTAWDFSTGSPNVVVANIDTGIRYTHDDLAANIWTNPGETDNNGVDDDNNGFIDDFYGWDFRYNDDDPIDQNGHGTHTSGTIGAVGNNMLGVVGVNWNVKIMAIKIYSPSGTDTTSAMLIAAYQYVYIVGRWIKLE
jgi:subtilisin family serine protease